MDPGVAREIEGAVREALGRHGVSGSVVVRGRQVELHGHGAPVSIDVEHLVDQWALLPQEMRARKVDDVARRLVQAHRAVGSLMPPGMASRGVPPKLVVIPAGVLLVVLIAGYVALRMIGAPKPPPPPPPVASESGEEAAARRARACEAGRQRIYAGASMGPFDTEGWLAELWIARGKAPAGAEGAAAAAPAPADAGLGAFVADGSLTPAADAQLAALPEGQVEIAPGFGAEEAARFPAWQAFTVRFTGRYVGAFLDPALRPRFVGLADRMADAASAELGALYGRCAHLRWREIGAWYRGADAPAAAAALVYGAGFFAELAAVDPGAVAKLGGASPLDALRAAGAKLDATGLGRLVGPQGGSITTASSGAVVITFPVGGPTRATSASRLVARKLGVGVGQD